MLSLLLHMHQPDYRDPADGRPTMPWVRLHATRGYRDIPKVLRETGARVTVNLVPSLLDQLAFYGAGGQDIHQSLSYRSPEDLAPHEAAWMLDHFFHGHPASFHWFPAWGALRGRRDAGERFNAAALRDVQVWSNLAWFGFSALRDFPELVALRLKGKEFSEEEKRRVLQIQQQILLEVPSLYRGLPELSASPYYHPILPLLINTAHAQRCMPGVPDPGFRFPEDARLQLSCARRRVEMFGPVVGLWPSEGSVSPEVLELAKEVGFRWFATDQGVLERSDRDGRDHRGSWEVGGLRGLFRDHELSDRIGFVYSSWNGKKAAEDLIGRLGEKPVLLGLDGENPWEAYADAGQQFLSELLGRVPTQTCAEMAEQEPVGKIRRIHTGSWINADFGIWIGQTEDREAWALLRETRQAWEDAGKPVSAQEHLLAAEGSDWFWWYGDDFSTPFSTEFDRLFRAQLSAVWKLLGRAAPEALQRPIKRMDPARVRAPTGSIGGEGFFGWSSAGRIDLRSGSMAPLPEMPHTLLFGYGNGQLLLKLLPGGDGWIAIADNQRAPFVRHQAQLPVRTELHLLGPGGHRLPAEGSFQLPPLPTAPARWDAQLGPLPPGTR